MVVVRGVNVFPSAVEEIIGQSGEVAEYRVRIGTNAALTALTIEIEPASTALIRLPWRERSSARSKMFSRCVSPCEQCLSCRAST